MWLKRAICPAMAFVIAFALSVNSVIAQARSVALVRDAEIEALLYDYATPILGAAGLRRDRVEIVLVNDKSYNAFVAGQRIFINLGTIVQSETPNELIGVIAHEIGHLAGGHLNRLRQQAERARTIAVVSSILGIGAAVAAGGRSGAQAGIGAATAGSEAARRSLLAYQRTEEKAADRSAITYLNKTGQSGAGLVASFKRLEVTLRQAGRQPDPYQISHPLPRERVAALETLAKESPHYSKKDSAALQLRHDRARAKILAYTYGPNAVDNAFAGKESTVAARYGKAISTFLYRDPRAAIALIDSLIAGAPRDPFYHEIKGEVLLKAQDATGAVKAFTRAVELSSGQSPVIQVGLGHALVLSGSPDQLRRAVAELEVAISLDDSNALAYRYLAMAYDRLGQAGNAQLATAEASFNNGNFAEAKRFAARAQAQFERGAPQWLRAEDIIQFKAPRVNGR